MLLLLQVFLIANWTFNIFSVVLLCYYAIIPSAGGWNLLKMIDKIEKNARVCLLFEWPLQNV